MFHRYLYSQRFPTAMFDYPKVSINLPTVWRIHNVDYMHLPLSKNEWWVKITIFVGSIIISQYFYYNTYIYIYLSLSPSFPFYSTKHPVIYCIPFNIIQPWYFPKFRGHRFWSLSWPPFVRFFCSSRSLTEPPPNPRWMCHQVSWTNRSEWNITEPLIILTRWVDWIEHLFELVTPGIFEATGHDVLGS